MPYIKQNQREEIDPILAELTKFLFNSSLNPGTLNYVISTIINSALGKELSYTKINSIIGMLECAKLELYRRVAVPYEGEKIKENGDVYNSLKPRFE